MVIVVLPLLLAALYDIEGQGLGDGAQQLGIGHEDESARMLTTL